MLDNELGSLTFLSAYHHEVACRYWGSFPSFCNQRKQADRHVVDITGFEDVPTNDEHALAQALSQQPISVAICANRALQFYHSGVFNGAP